MTPSWVTDTFDAHVSGVDDLVELGLRRNPKRAHLLVSTVLGKHIPTPPSRVRDAANDLGDAVTGILGDEASTATVLGFAETATGLGHCVAERITAARYLHSTRRAVDGATVHGSFEEGHSHATTHMLQPTDADFLNTDPSVPVVLVDDEISTGRTAVEAIEALHRLHPHRRYLVASLVDMRDDGHRAECNAAATRLGVTIDFTSVADGVIRLPEGMTERVMALDAPQLNQTAQDRGDVTFFAAGWPAAVPDGGRHGFLADDTAAFHRAVDDVTAGLSDVFAPGELVTVVGHEELMYLPLCIAERLRSYGVDTRFQTTSRSPAHVRDQDGYPLRRGFSFPAPETPPGSSSKRPAADIRYLYNVAEPGSDVVPTVLLVIDDPADTTALRADGGLLDVLSAAGHRVVVLTVPATDPARLSRSRTAGAQRIEPAGDPLRAPDFGSYSPSEVAWLLKDLSEFSLEGDVAERERRIQAGVAHYAESLPVEFQPGEAYLELFDATLTSSARRLALAVGTVAELILAERSSNPTLVSLARAGTPVGTLIARWIRATRHSQPAHYSVSIVRDRGIDAVALDYIAARHDPASVVFVDGWTGKGAIAKELTAALRVYEEGGGAHFDDELAVLADPGSCTRLYGTRDDFLIASACLNSTVSGLVSRTVLNADLIGPGDFHGAKFYRDLVPHDVSNRFLDAVTAEFDTVLDQARADAAALRDADRTPTWDGWASVEEMQRRYGLSSINFVKPGIGETTRVLLRRVPWRILVRDADLPDHEHIRLLAAERGVPVDVVPDLAYSCVGLIKESV
ncbi:phosphoribosyltransferase [Gordonia sp. PDNC005]|uniref:phosphoribosyltransferase n=1 Tax=unclassified Gordonia (in: high G+C Gram-positive bacteria) TaxID=2657482 RepID=UPI001962593C|nr:phosphoribosyltransferase [Gordonia sp. PDNC005]QRY62254.1 phosphoribosyltransferase [Gordonia sp. PDNC005]